MKYEMGWKEEWSVKWIDQWEVKKKKFPLTQKNQLQVLSWLRQELLWKNIFDMKVIL